MNKLNLSSKIKKATVMGKAPPGGPAARWPRVGCKGALPMTVAFCIKGAK